MKKLTRLSAGLFLGAMLCMGMFSAPQPAEAYYWTGCGYTVWCPDYVFRDGVRYRNTGASCTSGSVTCHYTRG